MAHPYMANSVEDLKQEMLAKTGASSIEELFEQIPPSHRLARPLELPEQLAAEGDLRRHLLELLRRNTSCEDALSFLGAGYYRHFVPAVCDEVASRHALFRPGALSGLVRVREPTWRAPRSRLRRSTCLQLGLRSWPCAPHGPTPDTALARSDPEGT